MYLIATILIIIMINQAQSSSCLIGRPACISSCMAQNCATGYCSGSTCVCSRCANGPIRF